MRQPIDPRSMDKILRIVGDASDEAPSTMLGRYRLGRELGRGAMAVVYESEDTELKRSVAIKIMGEGVAFGEDARQRFRREAQATAAISHPNVVTLYDAGEHDGRLYLVMEHVRGAPLSSTLHGMIANPVAVLELVEKIARGVDAAHARGVIHRDLKPGNILMTAEGEPKVGDFGLAQLVRSDLAITRSGAQIGTPLYMAPEQVRGDNHAISPATDVYALGIILYEAMTGRLPHGGGDLPQIYFNIANTDPESPRKRNPGVTREMEAICLKALEKDPLRRYLRAGEMADDLRRCIEGRPIRASSQGFQTRVVKRVRRNPSAWILGLVAATAAAVAIASFRSTPAPEPTAADPFQAAYGELLKSSAAMARLEDHFHLANTDAERPLREIRDTSQAVAKRYPAARSPQAWLGLAKCYSGDPAGGLADLASAGNGGDPLPDILTARALLAGYVRESSNREVIADNAATDLSRLDSGVFVETLPMKRDRGDASAALARATSKPRSRDFEDLRELQLYSRAVDRMGAGEIREAARLLAELQGSATLKDESDMLRGLAMLQLGQFETAALAFESAGSRGWRRALTWAGISRWREASAESEAGRDPRPAFGRSVSAFDHALRVTPADPQALRLRGLVHLAIGRDGLGHGRDGAAHFTRAIADHDAWVNAFPEGSPERRTAAGRRAFVFFIMGKIETGSGKDPVARYAKAIADAEQVRSEAPDDVANIMNLALFHLQGGQDDRRFGRNPRPSFDRAIELYDQVEEKARSLTFYWNRGNALSGRGSCAAGLGDDPIPDWSRADRDYRRGLQIQEYAPVRSMLASLLVKHGGWVARKGTDPRTVFRAAVECYDLIPNLDLDPFYLISRADAELQLGCAERRWGEGAGEWLRRAIGNCSTAIQKSGIEDVNVAPYFSTRAFAYSELGDDEAAAGRDPVGTWKLAIDDFAKAEKLSPTTCGRLGLPRGLLLERLTKTAEALEAYRSALPHDPDNPQLKARIAALETP